MVLEAAKRWLESVLADMFSNLLHEAFSSKVLESFWNDSTLFLGPHSTWSKNTIFRHYNLQSQKKNNTVIKEC